MVLDLQWRWITATNGFNGNMSIIRAEHIIGLFNVLFEEKYHTRLLGGVQEPYYIPLGHWSGQLPDAFISQTGIKPCSDYHYVCFTKDYVRSALHEIAHWVIAGRQRRLQLDYGYWYYPDGRSEQQQKQFEQVELLPQAIEWLFCDAAQLPFSPSMDNLNTIHNPVRAGQFQHKIAVRKKQLLTTCLPSRARVFEQALMALVTCLHSAVALDEQCTIDQIISHALSLSQLQMERTYA